MYEPSFSPAKQGLAKRISNHLGAYTDDVEEVIESPEPKPA
jgi:hypothetical protein